MKGGSLVVACIGSIWFAGILQASLAPHLAIGYGAPEFELIALGLLGLYCNRRDATLLGFGAGWVAGALVGSNLTLFVLSRSVAGFLLGWSQGLGVQRNLVVAGIATCSVTLIGETIMLLAGAHRGPLIAGLIGTLTTTIYNGVIATVLFGILSRIAGPKRPDRY